jgi:DNA-binding SARP family transcriptional activator/predicted ATPase
MEGSTRVRLLGTVQIERDGEPVRGFHSRKALALLAYLVMQGRPVPRERLADLFWGDKTESQGRTNLSWTLNRITSQLPDCLRADRHTVAFVPAAAQWLDVAAFEELVEEEGIEALAEAVGLYRGEFLEGLTLEGCVEFELWVVGERERWRQRVTRVLRELVAHYSQCGEYEEGLRFGRRLLALEPWREEAHREMMRLLAWSGQRGAALAQYETCCRVLRDELEVEPAVETVRLYERIRDGGLTAPVSAPVQLPDFSVPLPSFLEGDGALVEEPVFVAREAELARLDEFLKQALAGDGRVAFVTGEAGQGKTALIHAFVRRAQAAHVGLVVAGGNGNAHTGVGDPYLPFREVLGLLTGDVEARWAAGAMGREQAQRLWSVLPLAVQALVEVGPDLIGTFVPGAPLVGRAEALEMMTPGQVTWLPQLRELVARRVAIAGGPPLQQGDLFEQAVRVLRRLARERPLVVILDDLQWADGGSVGLLFHLGRRIEGSRILVLGAYRPAEVALGRGDPSGSGERERHPLAPVAGELKRQYGQIEVDLGQAEGRGFVDALLDSEPNRLGDAFRETLCRQTGGHALFTVELLRGMEERGDLVQDKGGRWTEGEALDWETLPARVEAVIAERIARLLKSSRQVLKAASVEGEVFTAEVVARVRGDERRRTVECLSGELDREHRLVQAQGLEWLGAERLSRYRFRHILFQRYLYNSLDAVERAYLHEAVGEALEELYGGGSVEAVATQLAYHFQEAGVAEKAVDYLRQAGERAVRMSAHEEATAHYRRALELLATLSETGGKGGQRTPEHRLERDQMELILQVGLGSSLQIIKGYGDPELDRIYARARELCRRAGETPQLLPVLSQLVILYTNRGEHQAAREVAEQYLDLAEPLGDSELVAPARYVLGWHLTILGEFAQARSYLEKAIAFYNPERHHPLTLLYGYDFGVATLSTLAWALWFLGYPDQALARGQEALALAQELAHPFSLAMVRGLACLLHAFRRDVQSVKGSAEVCAQLSAQHAFPYWAVFGVFFRGWALARLGQVEEGGEEMYKGIVSTQAMGTEVACALRLAMLAEVYREAGRIEDGLHLLAEASETSGRTGEQVYGAEVHRLRGELLLMQGDEVGAEASFQRAVEVARGQSAKSWELRATTSLCRLWQRQGKREEAHRRLADIYGWFTEGFDTPDLQDAEALLEALA